MSVAKEKRRFPGFHENLIAPKICYALTTGGTASLLNYLAVFAQNVLNISPMGIAQIQVVRYICATVAPAFWGAVADYFDNQRLVHVLTALSGVSLLTLIQFATSMESALLLIFFGYILFNATGSLLDTSVLHLVRKVGGDYGKQRLWGALGYGVFTYMTGALVEVYGLTAPFNVCFVLTILGLCFLTFIPAPKKSDHVNRTNERSTLLESGEEEHHVPTLMEGIKLLSKKTDVMMLLCAVYFMAILFGVLTSFLTLNLYNLSGGSPQIVGIAILMENISELPTFFYAQQLIDRLGTVKVLLMAAAAYFLRITYYAIMPNAWSALPFEMLHGISFGFAYIATMQYVYARAPAGCEATAMGILNGVQMGFGCATGTLMGGYLYQNYGPRTMWWIMDSGVIIAVIFILAFGRAKSKIEEEEAKKDMPEANELVSPANTGLSLTSPRFSGESFAHN